MELDKWIGKKIYIKTLSGEIFTNSEIIVYEKDMFPFINIKDKNGEIITLNTNSIEKIKEDKKCMKNQ